MNKSKVVSITLPILYYLLFLISYLQEAITELLFVFFLLVGIVILGIWLTILLLKKRKKPGKRKNIAIATSILTVLFCYEFVLLGYASVTHIAYRYVQPDEALAGSSIYSIGVGEMEIRNVESMQAAKELLLQERVKVLSIIEVTNRMIYGVKNRQLLTWLHLRKGNLTEDTRKNVTRYLGKEDPWLKNFLDRPKIDAYSAGLSLALNGRVKEGDFENHVPIAVTGAVNENGTVLTIGNIKEKIQIIEKTGIPYFIVPSENAKEAATIKKELHANVEIYDVTTVEEAIQVINRLNETR
ncbi:S16 family serine protease [Paenisporosarcina cavernae]|nr:S16 family serine protease [Paenisporosarcina cavernae]